MFHGTPSTCESCHADAHTGFFDRRLADSAPIAAGECARCHLTTSFSDLEPRDFDHDAWTGFALRAAHAQSSCESCHPRAGRPDETGRTFGRVAEHFGPHEGCFTCHADPHAGAFDGPEFPSSVDGRPGCLRCHSQASFRTLPEQFDHRLWTGFALQGVHDDLSCAECHTPRTRADETGRTWDAALGTQCADCHADPHAGQFRLAGKEDCAECHRGARAWDELRFDHDLDARFELGESHAELDCSACHETVDVGGLGIVRYRPLPTECIDCHGEHEDTLLRRLGSRR